MKCWCCANSRAKAIREIAETLEISIGTVESRIFRARAKFKDKLMQMHPEIVEGM
ncbi:MAG: sigma factor-like helix-turn-helix DNA-binding protein [Planctomycetota bacterium]